jgi:outer membrane protein TolC
MQPKLHFRHRAPKARQVAALFAMLLLSGCASFSPDSGLDVVADLSGQTIKKDVAFVRTADEAQQVDARVHHLLRRRLDVDAAVQIALLNNKGLQAAYDELALAEASAIQESLPPNPTFSISSIAGDGATETERQIVGDILALATLPFRTEIARERFKQAQLRAALVTLQLAADVRRTYYQAVATRELAALLTDAQSTAEATARLATKLGETARSTNSIRRASRCFTPKRRRISPPHGRKPPARAKDWRV